VTPTYKKTLNGTPGEATGRKCDLCDAVEHFDLDNGYLVRVTDHTDRCPIPEDDQ
jgi:hypothetical protein